ncbi:MAG: HDOD domain-containing protein [Chitinivibrionales bacterium]|nr:HDOD domain-containing protein [Chitinivibrionales bacterium]
MSEETDNKTVRPEADPKSPLLLIFSGRERIRDVLTVGLLQCKYRVTQAPSAFIANVKANQFTPDLIIGDITEKNMRDILLINRLRRMERTRKIGMLVIASRALKSRLEQVITAKLKSLKDQQDLLLDFVEFPFNFSVLLGKIERMVAAPRLIAPVDTTDAVNWQDAARIGEKLLDPTIQTQSKLEQISVIIAQKQWAFPYTVVKALDIIGAEESCCDELARCIKSDLSASATILKVVNTVYYAKRSKRITDLKEAVVRLGFHETRNLLSCLALIDLSTQVHSKSGFSRQEFWLHSLSTALIAEKLCMDCDFKRPELAFVGGLIHDLGKIPLDNNFLDVFETLLDETTSRICPFVETEQRLLGFTHADLAHYLTTHWNFPSAISQALLNHHNPERIVQVSPIADRIVQEAVFIANQLSKAMNIGHSCDEILREIPQAMLYDFKISQNLQEHFFSSIYQKLELFASYLKIGSMSSIPGLDKPAKSLGSILFIHGHHAAFHPLTVSLRRHGFEVAEVKHAADDDIAAADIAISMPEPGRPLDIVLYDDEPRQGVEPAPLRIFILDVNPKHVSQSEFSESGTVFINQNRLDMRMLLHLMDKFLE